VGPKKQSGERPYYREKNEKQSAESASLFFMVELEIAKAIRRSGDRKPSRRSQDDYAERWEFFLPTGRQVGVFREANSQFAPHIPIDSE
jgi:hypothetical protein